MNLRNLKSAKERRMTLEKETGISLRNIGQFSVDESIASTKNCENMIGVTQIPLGVAGPLRLRSVQASSVFQTMNYEPRTLYIPLATTEGALVASVNRGCKAMTVSGGVVVRSERIGATRGPVFKVANKAEAEDFTQFLQKHFSQLQLVAASTSAHLTLTSYSTAYKQPYFFVRFIFDTKDAMGMNMATIATQKVADFIREKTKIACLAISGNFCTDKKVSQQNIERGRGYKVWAEATIGEEALNTVLKTSARALHEIWYAKCVVGSKLSGTISQNAQAANVVGALFLATGQDIGHVVEGSIAFTTTEIVTTVKQKTGEDLRISVYLPDLMVGTVGGGTGLSTQREALELLGVAGGNNGKNAQAFAEVVGGAVLAGELSLLASLAEGSLVKAHQKLARSK